jgi:CRP/FNR family transcriptional regulator
VRRLGPGAALFDEGEPCRGLVIVADGRVEVRQISLRGREQVFHTEGPGATLGEAPLFDGGGYIASAVALAPTRVLLLPRAEVLQLCQGRPPVALAMLKTLARRVRHFAGIVSDLAFRPVAERLARHLEAAVAGPIKPGTCI